MDTITSEKEKQKIMDYVFLITLFLGFLFVWQFSLKDIISKQPPEEKILFSLEKANDLEKSIMSALKNPILKEIQPFEKIPPFTGNILRDNPFLPK